MLLNTYCGVKIAQLPFLDHPYIAEIGFYRSVENVAGKLEKKKFKNNNITSPFYFLLELKEVENSGELAVNFYDPDGNRADRKVFSFGEDGQYYEYILFFDKVENLSTGQYHYTIFLNNKLIYEDHVYISGKEKN